jgi:glycosyltransferase involved in cell wall biosynthesis
VPDLVQRRNWEWKLLTRLFAAATFVIAIDSRTTAAIASACPGIDVELIPNCVASEPSSLEDADHRPTKEVLFVGWMLPSKGVEELLEAWAVVRRPAWELRLVGGYEDAYLADLRSRLPFTEDIKVTGELEHAEVRNEFRACSVFVLPSHTEGFPNVVVEAMAAGAPVVATDVGAIPDMIGSGAGIVVPPRDTRALVAALESVIIDRALADRMGALAKMRAESLYGIEPVVRRYLEAWRCAAVD